MQSPVGGHHGGGQQSQQSQQQQQQQQQQQPASSMTMAQRQQREREVLLHRSRLEHLRRHRERLLQELAVRRSEFTVGYELPLEYPAKVAAVAGSDGDGGDDDDLKKKKKKPLRTSADFVNARLLEAGVPLGTRPSSSSSSSSSLSSLASHGMSIGRFVRDLEGTGCYDSVQVRIGRASSTGGGDGGDGKHENSGGDGQNENGAYNLTVNLAEKRWYKLYVGGGVNSDDFSSIASSASGGGGGILGSLGGELPKLQFETSASLLNLTGFADTTSASYLVDQGGSSTFRLVHDRPLASFLAKGGAAYNWLMPSDPRTSRGDAGAAENGGGASPDDDDGDDDEQQQRRLFEMDDAQYTLGGGSRATIGAHATFHDEDHESTRSTREFVRSAGVRLANHARGASRTSFGAPPSGGGGGQDRPSMTPPEAMAGPYLFLDWGAQLRDVLPRRSPSRPFALDCSPEVARTAGTYLKHSLTAGMHLNGCLVDDRYDPTMGYDAHLAGEVAGPPGDVGFWKLRGGMAWHCPLELVRMAAFGVGDGEYDGNEGNDVGGEGDDDNDGDTVIGAALHSSFNCGIVRPLTFGGLMNGHANGVPLSDRFRLGGPGSLRGFLPSGVGPRSRSPGGSGSPGGDALGGDLLGRATLAASLPFPAALGVLRRNGARAFAFADAGTCVALSPSSSLLSSPMWGRVLGSTRLSVGGGVSAATPMGRLEATYAVPIRYGPRDARRSVQFGFGFSFG